MIETVLGSIESSSVGNATMHEHLFLHASPHAEMQDLCIDDFEKALTEVQFFKDSGGQTIVDATPPGCGRTPAKLIDLSEETGINIIMSTGSMGNGKGKPPLPAFPPVPLWMLSATVLELADFFFKEVTRSAFDGVCKAGIIKVATSYNEITDYEKRVLKAAGIVSRETGVPITTHCQYGTMGLEQAKLLLSIGVERRNIILGHLDLLPDFGYYKDIASLGVWLQFDRVGRDKYVDDRTRLNLLRKLIDTGFLNQLLLGSDMGSKRYWRAYGGRPGLGFLFGTFVSEMMNEGISRDQIDIICSRNPSIALELKN